MVRTAPTGVDAPATAQEEDATGRQDDETSLLSDGTLWTVPVTGEVNRRVGVEREYDDRDESFLFSLERARLPAPTLTAEDLCRGKTARRDGGAVVRLRRTGRRYTSLSSERNLPTYYYNYLNNKLLLFVLWNLGERYQCDNRSPVAMPLTEVVDRA